MHNRAYYNRKVEFCGYTAVQILTQAFGVIADAIGFFQAHSYNIHLKQNKKYNRSDIARAYGVTPKAVSNLLIKHKHFPFLNSGNFSSNRKGKNA